MQAVIIMWLPSKAAAGSCTGSSILYSRNHVRCDISQHVIVVQQWMLTGSMLTHLAFAHAAAALSASSGLSNSTKAVPFSFCVVLSFTSLCTA